MCETCAHRFRIGSKHQRRYNNILPVTGTKGILYALCSILFDCVPLISYDHYNLYM